MPQIVLNLTQQKIKELNEYYRNDLKTSPPGAVFSAKTGNAAITAYQSGKVLFQGKSPEVEANKWSNSSQDFSKEKKQLKPKKTPAHNYAPPSSLFTSSHIGSDEAGTGDYFGPITVAAAYVSKENIPLLKELGVKDSKNLTDDVIQSIAKDLVKMDMPYSLVILHNEKYNELQRKGWSQGKMKTMLHHSAISKLLKKIEPIKPDGILIDQFSQPNVYIGHLKSEKARLQDNVYFMTKAESYSIAVAAGSIIARASFVKQMDKLAKTAGLPILKGASQRVDQAAAQLIKKHGRPSLEQYAKVHFANTKKAESYL